MKTFLRFYLTPVTLTVLQLQNAMYNRLFTKILDSSIWLEPCTTRIVWVTLIAAMDEDGYAHFSAIENLAARARVNIKDTQKAIDCFLTPDPNSANPANEGRRIERVPGGFLILNAPEHRKMFNREVQRENVRLRVAKHRSKGNGNADVTPELLPALQNVTLASVTENASESGKKIAKEKPIVFPASLDTEAFHAAWQNWEQHRREIKKPLTPTSIKQQLKDLAEFGEQRAIGAILFTIRKGWQGLREDDSRTNNHQPLPERENIAVPIQRL